MPEISAGEFAIKPLQNVAVSARRRNQRWILGGTMLGLAMLVVVAWGVSIGPAWLAYHRYQPQEGDLIFQSLSATALVEAIEGATQSSFSHCGMVALDGNDRWVVYESLHRMEATPLADFLSRGRNWGFAIYRLRPEEQAAVPAMLTHIRKQMGKPYDNHYTWDDESLYCSELIFKAYQAATGGRELGKLVTLGDLKWQAYQDLIVRKEGEIPVDRSMITPRDLALAEPLELIVRYEIEVPEPQN